MLECNIVSALADAQNASLILRFFSQILSARYKVPPISLMDDEHSRLGSILRGGR